MSAQTYADLARHIGHSLACVEYGDDNVAVECEDCNEVIVDFDRQTQEGDG